MSLPTTSKNSKPGYYLPHHAVIKSDCLTTKTRVVFDGSAKASTGVSLNEILLNGPVIQEDLFSIVTRCRKHPVVLIDDTQQMYRQIRIANKDRFYQKILWRKSNTEPMKTKTIFSN